MEKELYAKEQELNTVRTAKAMILLNVIQTINNKSYEITNIALTITIDNEAVQRIVYRELVVPNYYNQDVAAEASTIKRLVSQYSNL